MMSFVITVAIVVLTTVVADGVENGAKAAYGGVKKMFSFVHKAPKKIVQ